QDSVTRTTATRSQVHNSWCRRVCTILARVRSARDPNRSASPLKVSSSASRARARATSAVWTQRTPHMSAAGDGFTTVILPLGTTIAQSLHHMLPHNGGARHYAHSDGYRPGRSHDDNPWRVWARSRGAAPYPTPGGAVYWA